MIAEFNLRRQNVPYRSEQGTPSAAPEVYVARVPAGGVPAVDEGYTGTGTGTGSLAADSPGSASCAVYKVVVDSTGAANLIRVAGLDKTIYNLSNQVVLGQSWALVARDKFGYWYFTGALDFEPNPLTGGPGLFIGPVHVVDGGVTGTGDWYCQLVERSGSTWVVSAGPIDYSGVIEINGLQPRHVDTDATPGAVALAVTNLFADANGAYYIDYPYLSTSDTVSIPATWDATCNADGSFTITPATYQTVTISWDNWSDFPRVKIEAT